MENILNFLDAITANNNKVWFDQHKLEYKAAQSEFNAIVDQLITSLYAIDPSIGPLSVKECTYRIYRDVRFSKDKTPYKNHMGAYFCKGGKCSGNAGYYFHLEGRSANYIGGHLLCAGLHMPDPKALKSVREDIVGRPEEFLEVMALAKDFQLDTKESLTRVPKGFPADSPYASFLKLKNFDLVRPLTVRELGSKKILDHTIEYFRQCVPLVSFFNRAVDFARQPGD